MGDAVEAGLLALHLDAPTEQPAVERPGSRRICRGEVDPAGRAGRVRRDDCHAAQRRAPTRSAQRTPASGTSAHARSATTASTSISTFHCGLRSAFTTTAVLAGLTSWNCS